MKIKKYILFGSITLLILVFISENSVIFRFCQNIGKWSDGTKYCIDDNVIPEYLRQISGFLSIIFLSFSLITYRMKDQVFHSWWSFAKWFALLIIVSTLLLETGIMGGGGGWGIGDGLGEFVILWLLYIIFVVVSIIRIIWAYIKTRNK